MPGVLDQINGFVEPDKLFVSIAAGLTVSFLENVGELVFLVIYSRRLCLNSRQ